MDRTRADWTNLFSRFCVLTGLLQLVVHWAYSLEDGVRPLPAWQKLAGGVQEQEKHLVAGLEFLWPGWSTVGPLLLALGGLQELLDDGGDPANLLLHFLDVAKQGLEWRGLLLPCFTGHI